MTMRLSYTIMDMKPQMLDAGTWTRKERRKKGNRKRNGLGKVKERESRKGKGRERRNRRGRKGRREREMK